MTAPQELVASCRIKPAWRRTTSETPATIDVGEIDEPGVINRVQHKVPAGARAVYPRVSRKWILVASKPTPGGRPSRHATSR